MFRPAQRHAWLHASANARASSPEQSSQRQPDAIIVHDNHRLSGQVRTLVAHGYRKGGKPGRRRPALLALTWTPLKVTRTVVSFGPAPAVAQHGDLSCVACNAARRPAATFHVARQPQRRCLFKTNPGG